MTVLRRALALLAALATGPALAAALLGTVGTDDLSCMLLELDPATGATLRTIGPVGFAVNGMTYDPTTGTLFATTSNQSAALEHGVIAIDMTTGAGTPIGSGAGVAVNVPAAKSTGELYAGSQGFRSAFRLALLDKVTGVAALVGDAGLETFTHSLAFDAADTLHLLNGDGKLYTIDPATAAATLAGDVAGLPNGYAHHGGINPADGLLYALSAKEGLPPTEILAIDLAARAVVSAAPADPLLHTLAFVTLPAQVTVTRAGSGDGGVTSADAYINCGVACTHAYVMAPTVTLNATPDAVSVFTGWLGACTGTDPCVISVTGTINVSATFAPDAIGARTLDVDDSNAYDALTDGLLALRQLFGLTGAAMTNNALALDANRVDPGAIETFLTNVRPRLDVDGNGKADALTDGLMILRYLFGVRGPALVANAIGTGARRTTDAQVQDYIASLVP